MYHCRNPRSQERVVAVPFPRAASVLWLCTSPTRFVCVTLQVDREVPDVACAPRSIHRWWEQRRCGVVSYMLVSFDFGGLCT